jgi:hypothetical protein
MHHIDTEEAADLGETDQSPTKSVPHAAENS